MPQPEPEIKRPIESVDVVSDGILVRFSDGTLTYFPHGFLREHIGIGSNQVFVDRSPIPESRLYVASLASLQQLI